MKICPTCGGTWPDKANFCPRDGSSLKKVTTLEEEKPAANKEQTDDCPPQDPKPGSQAVQLEDEWSDSQVEAEGFSETQWFMAAQDPEKLKEDHTAGDLFDLQAKYKRDKSIPEEERRKFSLRKKKS